MNNGPGQIGRVTSPPLSEAQKAEVVRLRQSGLNGKQIALATGFPYQSINRHLRNVGINPTKGPRTSNPSLINEAELMEYNSEQLSQIEAKRKALITPAAPTPLAPKPEDEEEAQKRTTALGHEILRGAERLIASINNMSDEALQAATLNHKALALGILVDKLKVITNKAQPMFGGDQATVNIINIIASAAPARKKDQAPEDAEIIP